MTQQKTLECRNVNTQQHSIKIHKKIISNIRIPRKCEFTLKSAGRLLITNSRPLIDLIIWCHTMSGWVIIWNNDDYPSVRTSGKDSVDISMTRNQISHKHFNGYNFVQLLISPRVHSGNSNSMDTAVCSRINSNKTFAEDIWHITQCCQGVCQKQNWTNWLPIDYVYGKC